ncbi:MAG: YceD family protein [Neisseriaceae bacterium]|jgi:uncharacterized protein
MHININDFIKRKETISSEIRIEELERARQILEDLTGKVVFTLSGSTNDKNRAILHLSFYGKISALCQNCLGNIEFPINCNLDIPVFNSEEEFEAALLNKDSVEYDGIVAQPNFDVLDFIEDEIIMQLPIAPKHEVCCMK